MLSAAESMPWQNKRQNLLPGENMCWAKRVTLRWPFAAAWAGGRAWQNAAHEKWKNWHAHQSCTLATSGRHAGGDGRLQRAGTAGMAQAGLTPLATADEQTRAS